jgi:hypothetical protein
MQENETKFITGKLGWSDKTFSIETKEAITDEFVYEVTKLITLFDQKQHDYGSGNIAKFGEVGVLVRVSDKIERLANLQRKGVNIPLNEAVEDSWMDIATYAIIALMIRHGKWEGIDSPTAPPAAPMPAPTIHELPEPVPEGPKSSHFGSSGVKRG